MVEERMGEEGKELLQPMPCPALSLLCPDLAASCCHAVLPLFVDTDRSFGRDGVRIGHGMEIQGPS